MSSKRRRTSSNSSPNSHTRRRACASAARSETDEKRGLFMGKKTRVDVRVIAKGGKYLGDDIGGALVTVEDVHTGESLARGTTSGGSGVTNLMSVCVTQSEVLPVEQASVFTATLD